MSFGHSERTQRFTLTLLALACSLMMMSKCSQFISLAAFQHSCLVVVLLLAVKPLASYLEIKAVRLGGDCICVYINVFRVHA